MSRRKRRNVSTNGLLKLKGLQENSPPSWIFLEAILVNSVAIVMSLSRPCAGVDVGKLYSTKYVLSVKKIMKCN